MRVLISAYACAKGRGSEGGAGWEWARAAAQTNEVWLLTHATNQEKIDAILAADHDLAARMHPVYLRNPRWVRGARRAGPTRFLYYVIWQTGVCRRTAARLHAELDFDVAHHVTYASDWMPIGVDRVPGLPYVWGPVGGASTLAGPRLWSLLGLRTFVSECVRAVVLTACRLTIGRRIARRAACVLGQNDDVAAAFAPVPVVVEPHVALAPGDQQARRSPRTGPPTAVFAGRLLGWKGLHIALKALSRPEAAAWHFTIFGTGSQGAGLRRLADRLGVADRVSFLGSRPRAEVLAALACADAMLLPSIHDAAGWSVAEATAAGCPVVGLALGGPRTLVGPSDGVLVSPQGDVVGQVAAALGQVERLSPRGDRWLATRLPALVDDLYRQSVDDGQALVGRERS
jgi:glycosyltransferase involved in cell wall biosynthesis